MARREKCPHCGNVVEFHDHFCTHCWSHRTKGKVLMEEQVATCRSQLAARNEQTRWRDECLSLQKRMAVPTILMILWCSYWGLSMLPGYLKYDDGLPQMVTGLLCAAGFVVGGFLAGGMKAVPVACSLLILSSLVCVFHAGSYLMVEFGRISPSAKGVVWSSLRLVLCGIILVSCAGILRLKRPGA